MPEHFRIAIIGAGPGGLGAASSAAAHGLSHILFEKSEIGNTVFQYQLRKHVMAEPSKLPLRAKVRFEAGSREKVLSAWNEAIAEHKVNVKRGEVRAIKKNGDHFEISCGSESYTAENVVLAIGTHGSPRKLEAPGADLPHVAYTLSDPDAFIGKNILVVGAGDAAIENALALVEKNAVSILNRTGEFARAKDANIALILNSINSGKMRCFYNADIAKIEPTQTIITTPDGDVTIPCDHIIGRIGAIMPRKFVESCGIVFPNAEPTSVPVVNHRYESNVPGLFLVGSLIGYPLIKQAINQGYEVIEHIVGNPVEPADQVLIDAKLKSLPGTVKDNLELIRKNLPFFRDLSDPQFREVIIDSTAHQKEAGETVFERNDYTDTFFSIVTGRVAIHLPNGKEVVLGQGEYFGEMGLLSGRRRTAKVTVKENGILLETPRKQILKLISSLESIKRAIDERFLRNALQTSIFHDVPPEFLEKVVQKAKTKTFRKGEVFFKEGEPGDALYVIRKGSAKVSKKNPSGVDIPITYVAAGNYVGEMALLSEKASPRSATVAAAVGCETIVIDKESFREVMAQNQAARARITQIAEERIIENLTKNATEYLGGMLEFMFAEGITDAENVLIIDSDLCIACDNCEKACAATHQGYTRLDRKGGKSFAAVQIPISCRHCENPLCMTDCPPDALTRLPNGEVVIQDSCIGCGNCVRNCPYGVIQMVYEGGGEDPSFSLLSMLGFTRKLEAKEKGPAKAGKCDMCSHLESGPACVRSCPTGAAMRLNPSKLLKIFKEKEGLSWKHL